MHKAGVLHLVVPGRSAFATAQPTFAAAEVWFAELLVRDDLDRKRFFLRYVGGLRDTETVPAAFRCYRAVAARVGLPPGAMTYWGLHTKEDARDGPWMLFDVALPLAERYPDRAWELLLGHDQQRCMRARSGKAAAGEAAAADEAFA